MVGDAELLLDHPGNHGRGPHAVVQSVSHGTTVQNVAQLLALFWRQLWRPSRSVSFQQTFDTMRLVLRQPFGNLGARRLENRSQFTTGAALGIQNHGLQSLGNTIGAIVFRLSTQAS